VYCLVLGLGTLLGLVWLGLGVSLTLRLMAKGLEKKGTVVVLLSWVSLSLGFSVGGERGFTMILFWGFRGHSCGFGESNPNHYQGWNSVPRHLDKLTRTTLLLRAPKHHSPFSPLLVLANAMGSKLLSTATTTTKYLCTM
jgi:hypothetical protein